MSTLSEMDKKKVHLFLARLDCCRFGINISPNAGALGCFFWHFFKIKIGPPSWRFKFDPQTPFIQSLRMGLGPFKWTYRFGLGVHLRGEIFINIGKYIENECRKNPRILRTWIKSVRLLGWRFEVGKVKEEGKNEKWKKKGGCSLGREEKDYLGGRTDTAERLTSKKANTVIFIFNHSS